MTMKRDARFYHVLDECSRRVRQGEPLEQCLADYPAEYRDELSRLVPLARPLGRLARDPSPEFQARLERDLLASLDVARARSKERGTRNKGWGAGLVAGMGRLFTAPPAVRLAMIGLLALMVILGGSFGAVQASENSLPDSPLYQVKTAREWAELALAQSGDNQVTIHGQNVNKRARELEQATGAPRPRPVAAAVARRLAQSTEQMVNKALEAKARGNPNPANRALATINAMQQRLDRLEAQAPPDVRGVIRRLETFLERQEQRLLIPAT